MKITLPRAYVRFLAGLFTDLAAAWFSAAFISPGLSISHWLALEYFLIGLTFSFLAIKMIKIEERLV